MKALDDIFEAHEKLVSLNKGTLEFGFSWKEEDGIIFYNYDNNPVCNIVKKVAGIILKTIPCEFCCNNEMLQVAGNKFPNALVVIGESSFFKEKSLAFYYSELAKILPRNLAVRIITISQLGEFLSIFDEKMKFFDKHFKSNLANQKKRKHKVYKAYSFFQDSLSVATYLAILKRYLLSSNTLIPISEQNQYFEDVFTFSEEEVFVDLGGYTGDTIEVYLQKVQDKFLSYHIFEPSPDNYAVMQGNVSKLPVNIQEKITTYNLGAGYTHSSAELLKDNIASVILHDSPEFSYIGKEKFDTIKIVPLDDALKGVAPTFIKLDIEGYEAFAITGARELIEKYRPIIAISVYHYSFDLWELPLLVKRFCGENYRFYLRAYSDYYEYVCYCVPEERVNPIWK